MLQIYLQVEAAQLKLTLFPCASGTDGKQIHRSDDLWSPVRIGTIDSRCFQTRKAGGLPDSPRESLAS